MRKAVFFFACVIFLSASVDADAQSLLNDGKAGFKICIENIGNSREARKQLSADGWRSLGSIPNARLYTKDGKRVVVVEGKYKRKNICAMLVRKMTERQALAVIEEIMVDATSIRPAKLSEPENIAEWTAVYEGRRVRFYATREIKLNVVYGSSVAMQEE